MFNENWIRRIDILKVLAFWFEKMVYIDFASEIERPKFLRKLFKLSKAILRWFLIYSKDSCEQYMAISLAYIKMWTGRGKQFSIIARSNRIGLRMKPCGNPADSDDVFLLGWKRWYFGGKPYLDSRIVNTSSITLLNAPIKSRKTTPVNLRCWFAIRILVTSVATLSIQERPRRNPNWNLGGMLVFSDHHSVRLCTSFSNIFCKLLESAMGLRALLLLDLGIKIT